MNPIVGVPLLLILATCQAVVAQLLAPVTDLRPHLVLLAVIAIGLLGGMRSGAIWGAVGGLALDLASAGPFGGMTLCLALAGLLSGLGQTEALRFNRLLPLEAAFAGTLVVDLLYMLLLLLGGWDFNWIVAIYEVVLPSSLINLLAMPAIYGLCYWLRRRLRPRSEIAW